MNKVSFLVFFTIFSFHGMVSAQDSTGQKSSRAISIHIHTGLQLPGGDMAKRYGFSMTGGTGVSFKTSSNWLFETEFNYLFGGDVKITDSIFQNIADEDGNIINGNGEIAEVYTYERGYHITASINKILPVFQVNPNSGLTVGLGAGFMQHKIRIYNPENTAPQVCGDYVKGYDYLSNGLALREYVGFTFFSPRRVYSFRAGFEFVQAFTQGRRDYLFPLHGPDTQQRIDLLYGFKLSWTIPFMKSNGTVYYYF